MVRRRDASDLDRASITIPPKPARVGWTLLLDDPSLGSATQVNDDAAMRARLPGILLLACACAAPEPQISESRREAKSAGTIDADSVRDFSGEQGTGGWSYGYWNLGQDTDGRYQQRADFRAFATFGTDPINEFASRELVEGELWTLKDGVYYTSIWANGGHPNAATALGNYAAEEHWAVRRWTSPVAGAVKIAGHYGKSMPWGANWSGGAHVRIVVDDRVVLDAEADEQRVAYEVEAQLDEGSHVDFMLGPGRSGSIGVIDFTAMIRSKG